MDLKFNIIFVPGTVRYFRLAALSLLKFSPYRFRLVANGLTPQETASLREFCASSARLECYAPPSPVPIEHGAMLNHLFTREKDEAFCFMDMDVFATAPFAEELEKHIAGTDVFSSCFHMGIDPHEHTGYDGRCLKTPNGLDLATTFFAVYRRLPLRRVFLETGVGFETYPDARSIPGAAQKRLRARGFMPSGRCDTGKLLNLLYHTYGFTLKYHPLEALAHIGGTSGQFIHKRPMRAFWDRLRQFWDRPFVLSDKQLEPGKHAFRKQWLAFWGRARELEQLRKKQDSKRSHLRREHLAAFFTAYFRSLFEAGPEPVLAVSDASLSNRIRPLCDAIHELHSQYTAIRRNQSEPEA